MYNIDEVFKKAPKTARSENFNKCLSLLREIYGANAVNIVECGTIRQLYDSGDGWSTAVWKAYVEEFGGRVWTCDINERHMDTCRRVTGNSGLIEYIVGDSLRFLKLFSDKINLLYLDSYDTDEKKQCCVHQVNEANNALDKLDEKAIIMIDDVPDNIKGGKAEFSVPFLQANGFNIVQHKDNQIILRR